MKLTHEDRKNKILQDVIARRKVSVNELAIEFDVTMETIRKDITSLQEKNILSKKHGYVTLADPFLENDFLKKEEEELTGKTKIAKSALEFVSSNATIFLDTSTTVLQLARLLALRSDLTIITNSLRISEVLSNTNNKVLLTGGVYRNKSNSFVGSWALGAVRQVNFDIAFLGCDGFSINGPTISSYHELEIKKEVIEKSQKTAILAATTKLKNVGQYTFSEYRNIDMILMERKLVKNERNRFPRDILFFQPSFPVDKEEG